MKVLLLTLTIGAGHNQVAKNVAKEFENKGVTVKIIDLFKNKPLKSWVYSSLGFGAMHTFPTIANYFYDRSMKNGNLLHQKAAKSIKIDIIKEINEFAPDVIVSTHIMGRLLVKAHKKEINKDFLNYFIVTDYEIPPGLQNFSDDEYIILPDKDLKKEIVKNGASSKNSLPYGIPINEKFYKEISKNEAIAKLNINLNPKKKTVLVTSGGNGNGKVVKVLKELSRINNIQIINVAGKNKKLKKTADKIAKKSKGKFISYGFTDKMEYVMSVADFLIGKTGGITSTEAISKKLPLIGVGKTSKPESSNLKYLISKNMAAKAVNVKDINQIINDLDVDLMKKNYEIYAKKHSTKNIVEHIFKTFKQK